MGSNNQRRSVSLSSPNEERAGERSLRVQREKHLMFGVHYWMFDFPAFMERAGVRDLLCIIGVAFQFGVFSMKLLQVEE
jgi:hypothetical protein